MGLTHRDSRAAPSAAAGGRGPAKPLLCPQTPKVPVPLNQPVLGGPAPRATGGKPLPGPGGSLGGQNWSRFAPHLPQATLPTVVSGFSLHPIPTPLTPRDAAAPRWGRGMEMGRIVFPKGISPQKLRLRVGSEGFPTHNGHTNGKSPGKAASRPQGRCK